MPRICKSSCRGKVFSNIFISIYVNLNGFRANTYEEIEIYNKCSRGPYRTVHSAQKPANSILCTGEILTGCTAASLGYTTI
jgi:hypothetical protein